MKTFQIVSMVALTIMQLLVPLFFIYWAGFRKSKSKINLILKFLTVWTYYILIFFVGQWGLFPYLLRYVLLFLLIVSTIKGFINFKTLILFEKKKMGGWIIFVIQFLLSLIFFFNCIEVISGFTTDEKGIDIAFPLREGFIGQGGNSRTINYHQADSTAQHYALDIGKLNAFGLRASGFFPADLNKYAIYGDTLFSPCDGKIVKTQDGLDNVPAGVNVRANPAGNHIVLEYKSSLIVFAHLLKNSLIVSVGDLVKKGQPIARIGNSGHTDEPHLHIHAIAGTDTSKILKGNGIPIYFDGKFLIRNDRVKNESLKINTKEN
jgi:hypothetical protein